MIETRVIAGRKCHICGNAPNDPYIYWGMQMHTPDDVKNLTERLEVYCTDKAYNLIAFECQNWNDDFSPWRASAVYGTEDFAGNAEETCKWLINECIPDVEGAAAENTSRIIAGYSLAGLFALWAFYESGIFSSAVSCSGSLWYPEWLAYMEKAQPPKNSNIYLSLGLNEEKTKNKVMAEVGNATRSTAEILERDPHIVHTVLEWNPGGHFKDIADRLAKGIAWILQWD